MAVEPDTIPQTKRLALFRKAPLDGFALKKLIEASLTWLRTNQQIVNSLNVFPVPDGDTGTNMVLTMQAALDEIANSPERNFGNMTHAVAHGALMGARGNSGVILSQLWRGFARGVDNQEHLDALSMVQAFAIARDTAYKGVVRPVEGTILTVAKDIATAAEEALVTSDDPIAILEHIVHAADISVQKTPDLLPVLKKAGVVDAGGKGLFYILEGMHRYAIGLSLETPTTTLQPLADLKLEETLTFIEPGQDIEYVIDFQPFEPLNLESFYQNLEQMGTSIQLGEGDGIYRLHIHVPTKNEDKPVNYIKSLGKFTKYTVENLLEQMIATETKEKCEPVAFDTVKSDQIAVIAVVPGEGIARVFASLGVAGIVEGGQTMNPSTQEILKAFENLPTKQVIILPNNKNIIGAAQVASEMTVKKVVVIPSKSVPQGVAAMIRLPPQGESDEVVRQITDDELDEVVRQMTDAMNDIETGEITYATRSVEIDGVSVQEGQFIGLHNGKLVLSSPNLDEACQGLLEIIHAENFELITCYSGVDVPKLEINRIADIIRKAYLKQKVEIYEGGQPHYHFIISVE